MLVADDFVKRELENWSMSASVVVIVTTNVCPAGGRCAILRG